MGFSFKRIPLPKVGITRAKSCPLPAHQERQRRRNSVNRVTSNESAESAATCPLVVEADETTTKPKAKRVSSRKVGTEKTNIIKLYYQRFNDKNLQAARDMFTEDATFTFPGDEEISLDQLFQESQRILDSLPDFKFSARLFEEVTRENGKSFVVVHDLIAEGGMHTGKPYQFGSYPPIEATGTYVKNNPEEVRFHFEGEKICRAKVVRAGQFSGPAGLYAQLGGRPNV